MGKNINYIEYEKALTDQEILFYSQIITQFKDGKIDFANLKNTFLNYGVEIDAILYDFSTQKTTITDAETRNKRVKEQNYLYSDINYFVLTSTDFRNVVFRIDYKAIEVLSNYGIPEYQEIMISILKTQLKNSYNKDETIEAERNKWKRRIEELEEQLSKNNNHNKIK